MISTFTLDFIKPRKRPLPDSAHAKIYLETCTRDKSGRIFLTPDCVSIVEFEKEIDQLQKGLEKMRKRARKKFTEVGRKKT